MSLCRQILLWLLVLCFATVAGPVYALTPLTVAVLPVINTAQYRYADDVQIVQDLIKKPFKYPYYALLPADTVAQATQAVSTDKHPFRLTDEQAMAGLATTLSADIVVVVELSKVRLKRLYLPWYDDTYIDSDIVLKGYAYSAVTGKYDVIKVSKAKWEPESIYTDAAFVFTELTEQILVKLPYKRIPVQAGQ
ncbi:hypothetical protein [Sporomusa termitida]|uniref:Uncharacterized protein n=1 Tax=Sporomusa termitida TaxID=2377 RepID=A0A517DRD5_9FIRM|nr:hypothetical protein [Sporomusa termitida]QDR79920.1 hypothetical protein SPTER_12220 [Sporomusa termitida]